MQHPLNVREVRAEHPHHSGINTIIYRYLANTHWGEMITITVSPERTLHENWRYAVSLSYASGGRDAEFTDAEAAEAMAAMWRLAADRLKNLKTDVPQLAAAE